MRHFATGFAALVYCLIPSTGDSGAIAAESGWVLEQDNPDVFGKQVVTLSDSGIKLTSTDNSVFIVRPQYRVFMCNSSAKEYFDQPYEYLLKKYGSKAVGPEIGHKNQGYVKFLRKTSHTKKVAGLKSVKYELCSEEGGKTRVLREYWLTDDVNVPPKTREIACNLCGLPGMKLMPIAAVRVDEHNRRALMLVTTRAERVQIKPATFKTPVGYQRASSELALLMHSAKNQDVTEWLVEPRGH